MLDTSQKYACNKEIPLNPVSEHHSSVGSVADLRTGSHWFDPHSSANILSED